jgi:putative ABC transport system permease protein
MLKVTLRGLLEHKIRLFLTTLAVVAGVSFVVGAVVLTDSVRAQFDQLFEEIYEPVDLAVRTEERFDPGAFGVREPVDAGLLDDILAVPGVEVAQGDVGRLPALVIDPNGDAVMPTAGPPLGVSFGDNPELSVVSVQEGREPQAPDEVAFDRNLFDQSGYAVGDTVEVQTPLGPQQFELVGNFRFGGSNSLAGAFIVAFTTEEAQRQFGLEGRYDAIFVKVIDDEAVDTVREEVAAVLPAGVEVVDRDQIVSENQDAIGELVNIFRTVLLVFAFVSLFVAAFLIFNVFLIVVGQRVRELALLRAVGASSRQVVASVMGEALVVGLLASVLGFFGGLLVALGLNALLGAIGFGADNTGLVISPWAVVAAFGIGVGTTLLASILPAVWARKVPPVAAIREGFRISLGSVRLLGTIGTALVVVGGAGIAWGLVGTTEAFGLIATLGGGALAVFIGVALLSAALASPVARTLGAPMARAFGAPGNLARENAAREPSRTAFTAAALMIGLALVSMSFVIGWSLRTSFVQTIETGITADWYIDTGSFFGFDPNATTALAELPELESVTGGRFGQMQVDDSTKQITGVDFAVVDELFNLDVVDGDVTDQQGVLVHVDPAEDLGVGAGDTITAVFQERGEVELTVLAVYEDSSVLGNWVIDLQTFSETFSDQTDLFAAARTAPGFADDQARAAIEGVTDAYPQLQVQDRDEFTASQEAQLNQLLAVITVFLLFAVIIALIGIIITLALSVFERTRELGLLRAVGMSRRQVRRMVRLEAVIVAVFGALLGLSVGVVFGVAMSAALPDDFISTIDIPWGWLAGMVVLAGGLGVVAALYPAWRASRLDVLEAIASE